MASQQLTCRDCGSSFEFSDRDAEFYASKGFKNPSRCKDCRSKKNGGNSGSTNQRTPRATKPKKQMYDAFCAGLGQWIPGHHVQVPFETDPTRPFYCRDHKPERPLHRGDKVSMRYNANGAPTGSTFGGVRRDASSNVTGFSNKGPGGGLTHSDRLGNYTGSTYQGPGGGGMSTNKSGKIKSSTDTRGNRKGPMGNNKGSSSNL